MAHSAVLPTLFPLRLLHLHHLCTLTYSYRISSLSTNNDKLIKKTGLEPQRADCAPLSSATAMAPHPSPQLPDRHVGNGVRQGLRESLKATRDHLFSSFLIPLVLTRAPPTGTTKNGLPSLVIREMPCFYGLVYFGTPSH